MPSVNNHLFWWVFYNFPNMNMPLSDSLMYRVACLSVTFSWHSWTHICASCWAHIPVLCEIHEWEKAGDSKNESENLQCYFHADPNAFGFRDIEVFIFISSMEVVLIVLVTLEWEEKITLLLGKDMGQSVKMWTEGPQPCGPEGVLLLWLRSEWHWNTWGRDRWRYLRSKIGRSCS